MRSVDPICVQLYNDYLSNPSAPQFSEIPAHLKDLDRKDTLFNKEIEKAFMGASKELFEQKVRASTLTSKKLGNMYAASVYGSLASLLDTIPSAELQGKRVGLYSYGSGLAASFFSLRVKGSTDEIHEKLQLKKRLGETQVRSCEEYIAALQVSFPTRSMSLS